MARFIKVNQVNQHNNNKYEIVVNTEKIIYFNKGALNGSVLNLVDDLMFVDETTDEIMELINA